MVVLVTGARGHVGGAVLSGLLQAGESVRASSRTPQAGDFPDTVEVVQADLSDPGSVPRALHGVDKVFLYAQAQTATAFATAARDAGVQHVVVLSSASVVSPNAASNPIGAQHLTVERAIDEVGLGRTFLRPGYFATNALRWRSIPSDRTVRTAFPDSSTPMVHERDIADVAVRALVEPGHLNGAYALLGAGTLTVRQQVAAIADALEEDVRVEEVDVETYRQELLTQLPAPVVDQLLAAHGSAPLPPTNLAHDAVPMVLGRPALTFVQWARDHAEDFR